MLVTFVRKNYFKFLCLTNSLLYNTSFNNNSNDFSAYNILHNFAPKKLTTMRNKIFFSIITCTIVLQLSAQNPAKDKKQAEQNASTLENLKTVDKEGWTKAGTLNLNITQSGRNDYWQRGGEKEAVGIRAIVDIDFDYKKGKTVFLNSVRARYGMLKTSSSGSTFLKNDDFLNITSMYGSKLNDKWSLAALTSIETQFDGYFLSPGYIKLGPGFLYSKSSKFSFLISPAMANLTTKLATQHKNLSLFGVAPGKSTLFGVGAFAQAKGNVELAKNIQYKFFATAYSDYLNKPELVILDCTNLVTMTVNKYIGATIALNLRYNDWEVGKLQSQYSIGVGFSYKLY